MIVSGLGGNGFGGANAGKDDGIIFDVTTADFEKRVLAASLEKPVIIDLWAPWCGPCRQLGPILEQVVREAGGAVLMAKVNIDENPEIAQALRVQSIPTVYAFFKGQPVNAFAGAQPESEIRKFVATLVEMTGGDASDDDDELDIPANLEAAQNCIKAGDYPGAEGYYNDILEVEPENASAYAGIIRLAMMAGEQTKARSLWANAPGTIRDSAPLKQVEATMTLLDEAGSGSTDMDVLRARLAKKSNDHQARFDLAMALFAAQDYEGAIDNLVTIIRIDRSWQDEKARAQLLRIFDAIGAGDPVVTDGRRKLSSALFS